MNLVVEFNLVDIFHIFKHSNGKCNVAMLDMTLEMFERVKLFLKMWKVLGL